MYTTPLSYPVILTKLNCHNTILLHLYLFSTSNINTHQQHFTTFCTLLFTQNSETMIKLLSLPILVILLSKGVSSTTEPTITASPGVLPYVSAPDISSFFPTPSGYQPVSYGASEAPAPAPTSGEFEGKKSSGSARLDSAGAIVGVLLCFVFISSMVIV
uniref:Uncharacterized protein n=1 Tax=Phaseolus vulgaris TaxID=3885 RepID=V7CWK0_PHAVU|nr:hypothetical protein PHAVU_001G086200g [Phaseolus vulgaris]ESW33635.1 hypothetical protein PHAVU_001G086200g [Phaseolus vulgaris]